MERCVTSNAVVRQWPLFYSADALDHSLWEIFDGDALQALLVPLSEEQVLEKIYAAIQQLQTKGEPVTQGDIADIVGIPASRMKRYPLIQPLLNRYRWEQGVASVKFNYPREDELIKRVEHIIEQLEDRGESISVQRMCALVGLSYQWMVKYPRINSLLHQYREKRSGHWQVPPLTEEEKVQRVQAAIDTLTAGGETITLKRILHISGLTEGQFRRSHRGSRRAKALLDQYTEKKQKKTS